MSENLAGLELGGTKTVVVMGMPETIRYRMEFPTTGPEETLDRAVAVIREWQSREPVAALGVASFGPIRVSPQAADFGVMLDVPKPGWTGAPVIPRLSAALGLPLALDTDVNAAALAEQRLGAAQGCEVAVYLNLGTGVGGGIVAAGRSLRGMLHPELGHVRLRRASGDDFAGVCPFHGDCAEGLLSGPALAARFGRHPAGVAPDEPAWHPVAQDLAELLAQIILALSPQRIVIGGGVSARQPQLLPLALARIPAILGGYLRDCTPDALARLVVPPALGDDAGPAGALLLARRAMVAPG